MQVTESSESVLAGTKRPPFRLMVRCVRADGSPVQVRPAVSEEFVVRILNLMLPFWVQPQNYPFSGSRLCLPRPSVACCL